MIVSYYFIALYLTKKMKKEERVRKMVKIITYEPFAKLFLKVSPGFTWGYSNSTPIGVVPGFTWGESKRRVGLFF